MSRDRRITLTMFRLQGRATQAVVFDPLKNELFTATRGRGA